MFRSRRRHLAAAGAIGALVLATSALASCGSATRGGAGDGKLQVEASFYPLQWMAEQVGGDHVVVDSLTKPGAEPHDLELTPSEVAAVADADVVAYLSGFQPSVDDAVGEARPGAAFDARPAARLDLTLSSGGGTDPHFWLDPTRLRDVGNAFADHLASADPAHTADYRAGAEGLARRLDALDAEVRSGLSSCTNTYLVTSHEAFGYLAHRYGLTQVGVTGGTPDEEPSPSDLASVADFVRAHDVRTIYVEPLASPAVARSVATETGARTAVLDPIEGLDDRSAGSDYPQIMRANLAALQRGQPCP